VASINVQLSVTGLYFGTPSSTNPKFIVPVSIGDPFAIPPSPPTIVTVKSVMDKAVKMVAAGKYPNASMFTYTTNSGGEVQSISVNYTKSPRKPSTSPSPLPGLYSLNETLNQPPFDTVLQYYHYRPTKVNGKSALIQLNIDAVPTLFSNPPTTQIIDGDVIIWRMVTIETGPLSTVKGFQSALKSSEAIMAAMDQET
jgi:hypothetical protein